MKCGRWLKIQYLIPVITGLLLAGMIMGADLNVQALPDSARAASAVVQSPAGAMIRSAIIPGWGQWYNGYKLKAILVTGIEAGLAGNAMWMNQRVRESKTADERAFYKHHRGTFVWWFVGVYFLNILDAYVDAHFFEFDVSPGLGPAEADYRPVMRVTFQLPFDLN